MKKSIRDIDVRGKRVLVRVDFNVPLDENLKVADDKRITAALPTIKYLIENGAKVIVVSHLGRPKGKFDAKLSLKPVCERLSELLKMSVKMAPGCIDSETKKMASSLKEGEILLLENIRFDEREEKNDSNFAKELASLADIFVQDAFGTVHRAHASTAGVAKFLPAVCGFLVEKEVSYFSKVMENPERPFVAIFGGAKVSDKILVIENFFSKVDALIIGGAMAYTFLKAKGISVGNSLVEDDRIEVAKNIIRRADREKNRMRYLLPIDHIVVDKIAPDAHIQQTKGVDIPEGSIGVDIGPMTVERMKPIILSAKTIIWNGPMGIFEDERFAKGTFEVAKLVAQATENGAVSIIGGGDSASAIKKAKLSDKVSHISTGGGASIELLEGKELPGIAVLQDK